MTDAAWQEEIGKNVRVLQVIVGAMVTGVLIFMGIALGLVLRDGPLAPGGIPFISLVLPVLAAVAVMACIFVPQLLVASARRKIREGTWQWPQTLSQRPNSLVELGDAGKLFSVLMMRTIVATAILEGVAFFTSIVYLLEASPFSLAIVIVLVAGMAWQLPTRDGVVRWIEGQLQTMEDERLLAR